MQLSKAKPRRALSAAVNWAVAQQPEIQKSLWSSWPCSWTTSRLMICDISGVLENVIDEALRLHGAAGSPPCIVPAGGCMLAGQFVPEGLTVAMHAYTLHRDTSMFDDGKEMR